MYWQILIRENQHKFKRILWRYNDSKEICKYQLNTVTYGMLWAPFLATKALQQIAQDHIEDYPDACKIIL